MGEWERRQTAEVLLGWQILFLAAVLGSLPHCPAHRVPLRVLKIWQELCGRLCASLLLLQPPGMSPPSLVAVTHRASFCSGRCWARGSQNWLGVEQGRVNPPAGAWRATFTLFVQQRASCSHGGGRAGYVAAPWGSPGTAGAALAVLWRGFAAPPASPNFPAVTGRPAAVFGRS